MSDGQRLLPPRRRVSGEREVSDTLRNYQPSALDLSNQLASLSAQVTQVHGQVTLTRTELGTLSKFVMGDLAGRVTGVEAKTGSVPSGVKTAGKYSALLLAVPVILQIASELKPNLAGPLQTLIQLFQ